MQWHERLRYGLVNILRKNSTYFMIIEHVENSDVCLKQKNTIKPLVKSRLPCQEVLKILGLIRKESIGGVRYFATFTNNSTK